jgi:AcrR family transcriptional regulator
MKRSRGRPKQYDEEVALEAAGRVFWEKGFSATSLDDLSGAMEMNRPSIYRAFGDKEAVYRKALGRFCLRMEEAMQRTLFKEKDVRKGLAKFYLEALEVYTAGDAPLGCMVMSTAVAAATCHPEIQSDLLGVIGQIDRQIAVRLQQAIDEGDVAATVDAKSRAALAQAVLHTLSLRARAGESKSKLRKLASSGISMLLA